MTPRNFNISTSWGWVEFHAPATLPPRYLSGRRLGGP